MNANAPEFVALSKMPDDRYAVKMPSGIAISERQHLGVDHELQRHAEAVPRVVGHGVDDLRAAVVVAQVALQEVAEPLDVPLGSGSSRPSSSVIRSRCSSCANGAIVLTGSPGRNSRRTATKNVTTISTTTSCTTRRRMPRKPSFSRVPARLAPGSLVPRLLRHPHARHRVTGREARERAAAVGQCRTEHAVHVGLRRDGPDRVLAPDVPQASRRTAC